MGGTSRENTDKLINLLALDPQVHNGGPGSVHGSRSRSENYGWLLPQREDHPGAIPVKVAMGGWVYLTKDGGYLYVP